MLYYVLAAETGIEVSQTNLAHICEERPVSNVFYSSLGRSSEVKDNELSFTGAKLVTGPKY